MLPTYFCRHLKTRFNLFNSVPFIRNSYIFYTKCLVLIFRLVVCFTASSKVLRLNGLGLEIDQVFPDEGNIIPGLLSRDEMNFRISFACKFQDFHRSASFILYTKDALRMFTQLYSHKCTLLTSQTIPEKTYGVKIFSCNFFIRFRDCERYLVQS